MCSACIGQATRAGLPVLDGRACTHSISNNLSAFVIIINSLNSKSRFCPGIGGWMAKAGRRRPKTLLRRSCSGKPREIERPRMCGPFGPPSHSALRWVRTQAPPFTWLGLRPGEHPGAEQAEKKNELVPGFC